MTRVLIIMFHLLLTMVIFLSMDAVFTLDQRMTSIASASSIPELALDKASLNSTSDHDIDPESREETGSDCVNGTKNGVECSSSSNDPVKKSNVSTTSVEHKQTKLEHIIDKYGYRKLCLDYKNWDVSLKFYDPDTQICCNGLFDKVKSSEECCNGQLIDGDEKICCGDEAIDRSNIEVGCCESKLYFTNDTLCCNRSLHERPKYSACCGGRVISEITEICCQDRAFPKFGHDLECCESTAYDIEREVCCNGTVHPTEGINATVGACCGTVFYDTRCYTCNADSRLDALQDALENDLGNQTCCHGKIKIIHDKRFCCKNGTNDEECLPIIVPGQVDAKGSRGVGLPIIHKVILISAASTVGSSILFGTILTIKIRRHRKRKRKDNEENQSLIEHGMTSNEDIRRCPNILPREAEFSPNLSLHPETVAREGTMGNTDIETKMNYVQVDIIDNDTDNTMNNDTQNITNNDTQNITNNDTQNQSKDTDDYIPKLLYGDRSFATFADMFLKKGLIYTGNELGDHYKDIACQTIQKENSCNRRTIFGNPFEHSSILDMKNPTFTMPWSEVTVRLPDSILQQHPVEMHGTSFDNITSIHDKIKISEDEMVASPAVEYVLTGVSALDDYAVVIMPFIGDREVLRVWKFKSDDGMQTKVEPFEVPPKTKENIDQSLFYEIDGRNVRIFTKSFSGFFVTNAMHNRGPGNLSLHAYLFGSYKRSSPNQYGIRLMLYIADQIMEFKDFKKPMFDREDREGRTLLTDTAVKLTQEVHESDTLRAVVTVGTEECQYWSHVEHPRTNQHVYPEIQETKFCEIVQQCPNCPNCHFIRKEIPFTFEWYMTSNPQFFPSEIFKCFVDVICVTPADQKETRLTVEELRLRVEDRLPHVEFDDDSRLGRLRCFLTSMDDEKIEKFTEIIKRKYDCSGARIPEIIVDLQRKMKPVGIYEAIVATLQLGHMYRELSHLQDWGIMPDRFFPRSIPRTGVDESDMRNSSFDRRRFDNEHTSREVNNRIPNQENGAVNQYYAEINGHTGTASEATGMQAAGGTYDRHCRNELGSDLPVCSHDLLEQNVNKHALAGFHGNQVPSDAKGLEMGEMGAIHFTQEFPQQEHASFDETELKEHVLELETEEH